MTLWLKLLIRYEQQSGENRIGELAHRSAGVPIAVANPVKLLIGPWVHGADSTSHAGDVEFGQTAALPDFFQEWHLDWFDHFLRGKQNRMNSWPAVRLFVMGTGDGHKDPYGRLFHGGYWLDARGPSRVPRRAMGSDASPSPATSQANRPIKEVLGYPLNRRFRQLLVQG